MLQQMLLKILSYPQSKIFLIEGEVSYIFIGITDLGANIHINNSVRIMYSVFLE